MIDSIHNGSTNTPLDLSTPNLPLHMTLAAFTGIAWYNVIELNVSVYLTFKRKRGLYFWSVFSCIQGIMLHSVAFILKLYGVVETYQVTVTMLTIGWYLMVTGQALVLYSRLHLLLNEPRIIRGVLLMIIWNAITLHLPTTVLTYGSHSPDHAKFTGGFKVMEKLQMTMFCIQELIISGIYIWATVRFLRPAYRRKIRSVMLQLLWINVAIIIMDLAMLVMEYTGRYFIEAVMKGAIYSVKLKLEFAVLNQLMHIANSSRSHATLSQTDNDKLHIPGCTTSGNPGRIRGWMKRVFPEPTSGIEEPQSYCFTPSALQSAASTRHHQQQRNVSSRLVGSRPEPPSHGIAMTTEITQEFSSTAALERQGSPLKQASFYDGVTTRETSIETEGGFGNKDFSHSQLELVQLPSCSDDIERSPKFQDMFIRAPTPTAHPTWASSSRSPGPGEGSKLQPATFQTKRPSVANIEERDARRSGEVRLRGN